MSVQGHQPGRKDWLRLALVTIAVGVGAGLAGIAIVLVLNATAYLAFGHSPGSGTLLESIEQTPPWRRFAAVTSAGIIGAIGWYLLRRRPPLPISDDDAVQGQKMPTFKTIADGLLQMVVVGLGGSAGRELAPRQMGALVGAWLSSKSGLSSEERKALVACGAGAGLAAVYDIPLGGAIFALEVVYLGFRVPVVIMAVTTSAIAATVGGLLVPETPLFALERMEVTPQLYIWAILAGPIFGLGGAWFARGIGWLIARRPTTARILWLMPLTYAAVGLIAWPLPEILGDGGPLSTTAFNADTTLIVLALAIAVKAAVTLATYGVGTAGGTLTPSIAFGASLGALLGGIWNIFWPGTPIAAFAVVGAAAFLASAIHAPISALVIVIEFTGQSFDFYVPMMFAVAGSAFVGRYIMRRSITGAF
ncbi:chloride channel protein [Microbacterium sp. NPDC055910]|uniref:chloride channel protein n=1 Tax=Microbacterium sp. NPDC055910 TaxID=3345659 RepID=UPI0035D6F091